MTATEKAYEKGFKEGYDAAIREHRKRTRYPDAVRIDALEVGDIVRGLHGPCTGDNYNEAPVIGGPDDFREGFDVLAVTAVDDKFVAFARPYLHPGGIGAGTEEFVAHRDHTGLWYEMLYPNRAQREKERGAKNNS